MVQWFELETITKSVSFIDKEDSLIWQYESKGVYSSRSLHPIANFRGIQVAFLPVVWNLKNPPKVQGFFMAIIS